MLKLIRLKVTYRDLARWQAFADHRRVGLLAMIKECVDEAIARAR